MLCFWDSGIRMTRARSRRRNHILVQNCVAIVLPGISSLRECTLPKCSGVVAADVHTQWRRNTRHLLRVPTIYSSEIYLVSISSQL